MAHDFGLLASARWRVKQNVMRDGLLEMSLTTIMLSLLKEYAEIAVIATLAARQLRL